jgi:sortase A
VIRRPAPPPAEADAHHDKALLDDLLRNPPTTRETRPRPAVLRSVAEERRVALRPFLVRTGFDTALHVAERLLLLAVLAFFAYWFVSGVGRDMWVAWQQPARPTPAPALLALPLAATAVPDQAVALPFTTPDMEWQFSGPDYMAPRAVIAPRDRTDERPQRLLMPSIGVDTPVTEVFIRNGAWQVADYAAGYHHGTALPGTRGNTVMAGHAGLRGGVFRDLGSLQTGDELIVEAGGWRYRYRVRDVRSVWPTQTEVMQPTPTPVLTLITCTAWDTQRLVVVADLVDGRPMS